MDNFENAIEEARRLEKKVVEYAPYSGKVSVERTLDLEPKDYVELTYGDLRNMYERTQKIISASGLGVFATAAKKMPAAKAPAAPKAETAEVESKLKEMTTETLKTAEEVAKEPIMEKEAPEAPPEKAYEKEIEIEKAFKPPEPGVKKPPEIEIEKPPVEAPPPKMEEAPKPEKAPPKPAEVPKPEAPPEEKPAPTPPALRESPGEAAAKRYEQMEEQIREMVGEKADEVTLKKKMLELTKQLFKEKTTSKREEIKLQITVLKNMLAAGVKPKKKAAPAKGRKAKEAEEGTTHIKLLDTLVATHQSELSQSKDTIIDSYNKQIAQIKKKFYEDLAVTENPAKRKERFEAFVFAVESLVEQLPDTIAKYRDFTSKKHAAELEKLKESLGPKEKEIKGKVEERLAYVQTEYDKEFASVKGIVGRQIENLIELAGSEIFKKPEEKPKEAETKAYEVLKEINETDEGTLLYFLHSKDPDYYKRYERKQLSKAEVIFKAKELMAKEKGLGEDMVRKYFSQTEG